MVRRAEQERDAAVRAASGSLLRVAFPPERMRQLLHLCHPDKHSGSKTANEITQWLLEMRNRR